MISSFVEEDGDGAVPSPKPALALASSSVIVPALPLATGFFDEEYAHGKRVMTPPIPLPALTSEPITGKRTNQDALLPSLENTHLPKRANQGVPLAPSGQLLTERSGQAPASAPHVEGPTLCLGFAIREGSVIATIDCDLESPEDCRRLSDRIFRSLLLHDWKTDFKAQHIPSRLRDAHVHDTLTRMLVRRDKTEARLNGLYENPDGTRREGNEDEVEAVYERLKKQYNNINRAMLTVFAQFLIADLPASSSVEGTAFAIGTPDIRVPEPPCPYSQFRDHPSPPPTCPVFDPIVIDEIYNQALLTQRIRPSFPTNSSNSVWAVADSGATHILIKDSDAHILTNVVYTSESSGPLAVLNTANGQPLTAIGQGTLNIGTWASGHIYSSRGTWSTTFLG